MSAKTDYQEEMTVLSDSGVAVVMSRTSEPIRVVNAMREWAASQSSEFRCWTIATGFTVHKSPQNEVIKLMDPIAALKAVADMDGGGAKAFPGVTVIEGFHPFMKRDEPNPLLVSVLRQYAFQFPSNERFQRLVLVMPEEYTLPDELQHDIPVLDYGLPDREELSSILQDTLASAFDGDNAKAKKTFSRNERDTLVGNASGMTALEAETAFSEAVIRNREHLDALPFEEFNRVVLRAKTHVVKRSEVLELMPVGNMSDVGGLDELKAWMRKRRGLYTPEAREFGAETPKGIALIGPPGTGKSLSARAIAHELDQPLIRFDVGKVFGSLVGQSEGRVRSALRQLEAMAPCVAFIDEVDKAGLDPRGPSGDGGTSQRVMGSILTFMQECPKPIFWLFTANRVAGLPPEMLRKGRLDEVFSVLPPNRGERHDVLRIHLAKRRHDIEDLDDIDKVLDESEGYVSAEIEAAIKEAVVEAFSSGTEVTAKSIILQLRSMKPMSVAFKEDFDKMREWAANNARPASSPDALVAEIMDDAPVRRRRRLG